jgi:hypothetical protein
MKDLKLEDHPLLIVCEYYFVQSEELVRCTQYECVFFNPFIYFLFHTLAKVCK